MPAATPSGVVLLDLAARAGGAEKRVLQLAEQLPAAGLPAVVVALRGAPLAVQARAAGLDLVELSSRKWDPRNVTVLRRVLRARPGWVVDAHNTQSQAAALLAGPRDGRAYLATVHSEYRVSEGSGGAVRDRLVTLLVRSGWSLIAVTSTVASYLARSGVPADRVSTVWSAVDPVTVPPDARARVRTELGVSDDRRLLVAAGRLVPAKDYPRMLEAVALLDGPDAPLLAVAGDGPLRTELEQRAAGLGLDSSRVRFLGHRSDVAELFAAADAVLMTSATEGLPYTLLEAAAVRTPIISTDVGAIGEIFGDGAAVLLPADAEPAAVADVLRTTFTDPARLATAAERAAQVLSTRLTMTTMTAATLAAYTTTPRGIV